MNRKSFLKGSALRSEFLLPVGANGVYAESLENSPIDKFTDASGNFIHLLLP